MFRTDLVIFTTNLIIFKANTVICRTLWTDIGTQMEKNCKKRTETDRKEQKPKKKNIDQMDKNILKRTKIVKNRNRNWNLRIKTSSE